MTEVVPRAHRGIISHPPLELGRSRSGSPIELFGQQQTGTRLMMSGLHGDEPEAVVALSAAMRMLPRPQLGWGVLLCANPDGIARGTRGNALGVDLNRNFPASDWQAGTVTYRWSINDPRDTELSPGRTSASEPETECVIHAIDMLNPPLVVVVHAPLGMVEDSVGTDAGRALADATGLPLESSVGYETPGSFGSWAMDRKLPVVTLELPHITPDDAVRVYAPILAGVLGK